MALNFENMTESQLDVLREVSNIGTGNAITSLSIMLDKKVSMDVPIIQIIEFKEAEEILGSAEKIVVSVYFKISGEIKGYAMLLFDVKSAKNLTNALLNQESKKESFFSELEESAIKEIGNIMGNSFINALNTITNLSMSLSIPDFSVDMAGAILSTPLTQFGQIGDKAMLIETAFVCNNKRIEGIFFLIPDTDSYASIFNALGVGL